MDKIICAICGTSYTDGSECCPVCGYAQNNVKEHPAASTGYVPVKGGRFSSSNVKKRNHVSPAFAKEPEAGSKKRAEGKSTRSNTGAIIVIVLLLLAIIAVAGYISLRFLIPNDFLYEGLDGLNLLGNTQEKEESPKIGEDDLPADTQPSLDCVALSIRSDIVLNGIDATYQLVVTPVPADTVDQISYSSSDEAIVIVNDTGLITALAEGNAVVTVKCGAVSHDCYVVVNEAEAETDLVKFMLNRKEIEFTAEDESWVLYDGVIPSDEIIWTSDDTNVAVVEDGEVVAIANGETVVYGIYGGQTASCLIRCTFEETGTEGTGNVSAATGGEEEDDNKTYSLHNPQGQAKDVTIGVGHTFVLQLIDQDKNVVTDAAWNVEDTNVCTYAADGTVTGVHGGMTKVTATYKGKSYSCIVRVA